MGSHYSNCDYGSFECTEPERCYFCGEYCYLIKVYLLLLKEAAIPN